MKQLTTRNWGELDPTIASGIFVRLSLRDGAVDPLSAEDWVRQALVPQLAPHVPEAVREMFEIARGAIVYGVYFYPLFTLGSEQLLRVQEAAAREKAAAVGVDVENATYQELLRALRARGFLSGKDAKEWSERRKRRNFATHADRATILPPATALQELRRAAESMNRLFA